MCFDDSDPASVHENANLPEVLGNRRTQPYIEIPFGDIPSGTEI